MSKATEGTAQPRNIDALLQSLIERTNARLHASAEQLPQALALERAAREEYERELAAWLGGAPRAYVRAEAR